MNCTITAIGRFHYFHLARQLSQYGILDNIYTGYPRFKLRDETGIPKEKIKSFPWFQTPFMARGKLGLDKWDWLSKEWAWQAYQKLDTHVKKRIQASQILIAQARAGLQSGIAIQEKKGIYICDRGSSHTKTFSDLLHQEYQRAGFKWSGLDSRTIDKEIKEFEIADYIIVPSQFNYDSFIENQVPREKIIKIPYGANLNRFYPVDNHATLIKNSQTDEFIVLFVGNIGLRKGILDLLSAFKRFTHPKKKLRLVGNLSEEAKLIFSKQSAELMRHIELVGILPNAKLRQEYSNANVFVLPSIEEGLAMVMGEAMACGCPVIATTNTGASELIRDGEEGFIVPIRYPEIIADRLQQLADERDLQERMGRAALEKVKKLGGWDDYGSRWFNFIKLVA